ncbi:BrnA antitoxin family protein [Dehalococcoidia bacterium]|nr:BrnA antitoxin family protein [Dehalococcoidia bacterium]MCL0073969.1 BrnA antitoxin family protein [Dehalococcoidia bacterium]MCL0075433.1 BrnA antitoxin family protein [Dehalococcoidia bacterium]
MKNTNEKKDQLPEEFSSYEEAGKFWDTHDSTNYLEYMTPVEVDVRLDRRHFEIDVDEEVIKALEERAISEHISASRLANELLRRELVTH